jgi:hypothetical protein
MEGARLLREGVWQAEVARRLGVRRQSVGTWANEDPPERGVGAEGGAAGKTSEAASRTVEAGGETVGAWSAGDAVEEMDGAAGGGVD